MGKRSKIEQLMFNIEQKDRIGERYYVLDVLNA